MWYFCTTEAYHKQKGHFKLPSLCKHLFYVSNLLLFHTVVWYKHKILLSLHLLYKEEFLFFNVASMPQNFLKVTKNCWTALNSKDICCCCCCRLFGGFLFGFFSKILSQWLTLLKQLMKSNTRDCQFKELKKNTVMPAPAWPVPTAKGSQTVTTERILMNNFSMLWETALSWKEGKAKTERGRCCEPSWFHLPFAPALSPAWGQEGEPNETLKAQSPSASENWAVCPRLK